MATLTVVQIPKTGVELILTAAAGGGDAFANDGQTVFILNNGSGGDIVATFVTQATKDGLAVADRAVTITAGDLESVADLDPEVYNDTSGLCQVTYDGVTSLTVNPFRLNKTW